jgi:DNA mismatch repair protein MutL
MPKVIVLPDHIASQIAAGEVVERPSSVVKELVENSIDAGATRIVVTVEKGCRTIKVADNGCGMAPADLTLAFQRHATSKLKSADDLWQLSTLGFRGEALPSIASIARVCCYTRTSDSTTGNLLESVDGNLKVQEVGCSPGTIIEVYDLFFNVPARLNFLKKPTTEFAHIHETLQALAIAHSTIAFELHLDESLKMATTGSGNLAQTIIETGHFSQLGSPIEIETADTQLGFRLTACLAGASHFRGDRKGIISIVNQRPVRCSLAYKALDYAFTDLIPRGRYPLAVTLLSINPKELDVNIHPSKKEVKYALGNEVFSFLQRTFTRALRQSVFREGQPAITTYGGEPNLGLAVVTDGSLLEHTAAPTFTRDVGFASQRSLLVDQLVYAKQPVGYAPSTMPPSEQQLYAGRTAKSIGLPLDWRLVGYIHNTYILIETKDGLSIIEQHIAHERTLYEKLLLETQAATRQADHLQKLIVSCPLNLTDEQSSFLADHLSVLAEFGFEFERTNGSFTCTQVPVELANKDYPKVVQEILQNMLENSSSSFRLEAAKSVACQSAIKNGMPLSETQILDLLKDWFHTPRNETCPHGRPIQLQYSMRKLFQLFHPQ